MNCGAARKYLYNLGSRPVEPAAMPIQVEAAQAQEHLAACAACQEFFNAEERLRLLLRRRAPRPGVSAAFREKIFSRIASARSRSESPGSWIATIRRHGRTLALAGALIVVALLSGLWVHQRDERIKQQQLVSILVDDHAHNLSGTAEIRSSDRNLVQSWFRERIDFNFRLPPMSDPPVLGGRLCYLQGRRAALVFYQHPQSSVSLFILDGSDVELPREHLLALDGKRCLVEAKKGYNVVLWEERGLLYGLVSGAPRVDLLALAAKF